MIKVGLILYSVREEMEKDPIGTVEKVGKLGYRNIEVCNHNAIKDPGCGFGVDAQTLRSSFDKMGSKVIGAHVFPIEKSDIKAVIAYNKTLGNTNIVNPMGKFSTYDDLMRQCEEFDRVGKICHEEGMFYLYHNHDQEFRTFNGKSILDHIVENTEYVSLEFDTFWVMRAGLCPVDQLKHFAKRIKLVHQKDFAWDSLAPINLIGLDPSEREMKADETFGLDGESDYAKKGGKFDENIAKERRNRNSAFTEIGTGIMPIQEIIDTVNEYTKAEYIILEQDFTRMENQLSSVEKSMEAFRKFTGLSWDK